MKEIVLYLTTGYADAGSIPLYKDSTPDVIVNQACVIPPTLFFKYSLTSRALANHITNSRKHRFSSQWDDRNGETPCESWLQRAKTTKWSSNEFSLPWFTNSRGVKLCTQLSSVYWVLQCKIHSANIPRYGNLHSCVSSFYSIFYFLLKALWSLKLRCRASGSFWWVGAQTPLNVTAVHLVPERSFINKTVIDSSTKSGPKKGQVEFPPPSTFWRCIDCRSFSQNTPRVVLTLENTTP